MEKEGSRVATGDFTEAELALVRDAAFARRFSAFPWATLCLVFLISLLYFWILVEAKGERERAMFLLLVAGAKVNALVADGELWRLVGSALLHGGFLHLLVNCLGVLLIGWLVEKSVGPGLLLTTFTASAAVGGTVSYWAGASPSVGASGGMFGLLGTALSYNLLSWKVTPRFVRGYFVALPALVGGLSLTYGFVGGNVDNYAHLGGGTLGLLLGAAWHLTSRVQGRAPVVVKTVLAGMSLFFVSYSVGAVATHLMFRFNLPETRLAVRELDDGRSFNVPESWDRGTFREGRCFTGETQNDDEPACYVDPFYSIFLAGTTDRLAATSVYAEYARRQQALQPKLFVTDEILWKFDPVRGLAFAMLSFDGIADKYRPLFEALTAPPSARERSSQRGKPSSKGHPQ